VIYLETPTVICLGTGIISLGYSE